MLILLILHGFPIYYVNNNVVKNESNKYSNLDLAGVLFALYPCFLPFVFDFYKISNHSVNYTDESSIILEFSSIILLIIIYMTWIAVCTIYCDFEITETPNFFISFWKKSNFYIYFLIITLISTGLSCLIIGLFPGVKLFFLEIIEPGGYFLPYMLLEICTIIFSDERLIEAYKHRKFNI